MYDERDEADERHTALTGRVRSTAGIPDDAQRLGLDRNTIEGAMVAMSGSLNASRLSHRILAWVLLAALVVPLVLGTVRQFF